MLIFSYDTHLGKLRSGKQEEQQEVEKWLKARKLGQRLPRNFKNS